MNYQINDPGSGDPLVEKKSSFLIILSFKGSVKRPIVLLIFILFCSVEKDAIGIEVLQYLIFSIVLLILFSLY